LGRFILAALRVLYVVAWVREKLPSGGRRRRALAELAAADPSVRARGAIALGGLRHPDAVNALVAALNDPDDGVRHGARASLERIGTSSVGPLVAAAATAPAPGRVLALRALGVIGSGEAAGVAVDALADPDPTVRRAAADTLRLVTEPRGLWAPPRADPPALDPPRAEELLRALDAEDYEVRLAAAVALGEHRHAPAAPALRARLRDEDEASAVRGACAVALGRIGDRKYEKDLLWLLAEEETHGDLAGYGAQALRELGGGLEKMLDVLDEPKEAGRKPPGQRERLRAIRTVADLGAGALAVGPLLRCAAHVDPKTRTAAIEALAAIVRDPARRGQPRDSAEWKPLEAAVASVVDARLRDPDARVRRAAIQAAATLGTLTTAFLAEQAAGPDPTLRDLACGMLGERRDAAALDALARAREDEDEFVRASAAAALGKTPHPAAEGLLARSLADPAARVRIAAAYALAPDRGDYPPKPAPATHEALVRAATDGNLEVRAAALRAFAYLRDADAVDATIAALSDPEPFVRRQAAETALYLGRKRALPALRALASDPDSSTRAAAETAVRVLERRGR
jgi:HEAT repeat protein